MCVFLSANIIFVSPLTEFHVLLDHEDFYEGRLFGEVNSHVSAHLEDGMMTASIHVGDETYHIEVSFRFFQNQYLAHFSDL